MPETLSPPVFSAILAGTLLTIQTITMLMVGAHRNRARTGVGNSGDIKLERLVRRHGNLAENAAIFLVVLALYELLFGDTIFALVIGVVFLVARMLHIIAFSSDSGSHLVDAKGSGRFYILMRMAGAGLTALSTLALGLTLVVSIILTY
ncbi:MAG: MAPEG family protein [Pseudomonadota bacterium]